MFMFVFTVKPQLSAQTRGPSKFSSTGTRTVCSPSTHYGNSSWFHLLQIMLLACTCSPTLLSTHHTLHNDFQCSTMLCVNLFDFILFLQNDVALSIPFYSLRFNSILLNFGFILEKMSCLATYIFKVLFIATLNFMVVKAVCRFNSHRCAKEKAIPYPI